VITSQEIHWAAGFLDGEGYFQNPAVRRCPRISAAQKQAWPLLKLKAMFGGSIYYRVTDGRRPERRYFIWERTGRRAIAVMMTVYCLMSPRRQERIRAIIEDWKGRAYHNIGRYNREKTHCKRGHEFTPENTYAKDGKYRQCRTCQRMNALKWYHAQKV
jgi:hypothetical protein